jgi:hypothetical protein
METVLSCEACGSNRLLEGPAYAREQIVCLECGYRTASAEVVFAETQEELEERAQDEVTQIMEEFPSEGFKTPEAAEAYLKKLQKQADSLLKGDKPTKTERTKKKPPVVPTPKTDDIEEDLVWLAVHVYQRKGSNWNQTLKEAREEKRYRNINVRVFAHEHHYGGECLDSCREMKGKPEQEENEHEPGSPES